MKKIMNNILVWFKYFFLIIIFIFVLYFMLLMKEYYNASIKDIVLVFIPFFLLTMISVFAFFLKKESNLVVNMMIILAFITIAFILSRAYFDSNMINLIGSKANYFYLKIHLGIIKNLCYLAFGLELLIFFKDKIIENNEIHS